MRLYQYPHCQAIPTLGIDCLQYSPSILAYCINDQRQEVGIAWEGG